MNAPVSSRAASLGTNTGEFLFGGDKSYSHRCATAEEKMIDVTVEAIDPRGESAQISFPEFSSRACPTPAGGNTRNSKNSRWRSRGRSVRSKKRARRRRSSNKESQGNGENVEKSASADENSEQQKKTRRLKISLRLPLLRLFDRPSSSLGPGRVPNLKTPQPALTPKRGLRHVETPGMERHGRRRDAPDRDTSRSNQRQKSRA